MTFKTQYFVFTRLRYTDSEFDQLQSLLTNECKYVIMGKETAPISGLKHIQGYCVFYESKTIKQARKLLKKCYIEPAKAGPIKNTKYCKKSGVYYVHGSLIRVSFVWNQDHSNRAPLHTGGGLGGGLSERSEASLLTDNNNYEEINIWRDQDQCDLQDPTPQG